MPHSLFEEELDGLHFVKAAREELQGVIGATTTKKLAYFVIQNAKTVGSASRVPSLPSFLLSPFTQQHWGRR